MRGAMNHFDQIQGGEAGESPTAGFDCRVNTGVGQNDVAQGVALLFDFGGVVLTLRDRCGYRSDRTPCQNRKSVATPHTLVFQQPARTF